MSGKDIFLCSDKEKIVCRGIFRLYFIARLTALLLFVSSFFSAQEKSGITHSNYSPVNSIHLNPSSSADSRVFMQLRLAGAHVFGSTNLGYLPSFSYWSALQARAVPAPVPTTNNNNKYVLAVLAAEAPCFILSTKNLGVGFYVRGRSVFNVRRLPHQLTSLFLSQKPVAPELMSLDVRHAGFNNMSWLEGGVNFSYIVYKQANNLLQVGANLAYLSGINIIYGNVSRLEGAFVDSSISVSALEARMLRNSPALFSGRGFGGDLGITFKKMLGGADRYLPHSTQSGCQLMDYKYKIGFSLRDIGYIKFSNNMVTQEFNGSGELRFSKPRGEFTQFSAAGFDMRENNDAVRAMLPMSASLQFDYNFENHVYVAAVLVKNLVPNGAAGVQSPDIVAVIPRLEYKNIELALPVTLQRFVTPHAGFAVRIRSLVLGTDNLVPLVIKSDVRTMGVYANLSISLFRNPKCSSGRRSVDACRSEPVIRRSSGPGLIKRIFRRNKTYRR